MTTDEKRIAVCEWMGWTYVGSGRGFAPKEVWEKRFSQLPKEIRDSIGGVDHEPLPPLTLDWLHECIARLTGPQRDVFIRTLKNIVCPNWDWEELKTYFAIFDATAEQCLDALMKVILAAQ